MKMRLLGALLALALVAPVRADAPALAPTPDQARAAYVASMFLSRYHYATRPLDDALSARIFERYLKSLDPDRLFFTQADIERFGEYRERLDDAILQGDLEAPFVLYRQFQARVAERIGYARSLLDAGFDFGVAEALPLNRGKGPWPRDEDDIRALWRKRVKNDWLSLKLAGKPAAGIRETLARRYDTVLSRSGRIRGDDVFQLFMNAYAGELEPHTAYMGRSSADSFDITMRLSLVGIGAVLQERDDYITIRELSTGGPAARSGQVAVGDRIVGVAQGAEAPLVDVVGARVDDVVKMIRGTRNTEVVLDLLPADAGPDGRHRRVSLVRDTIRLEEQAAKKSVLTLGPEGRTRIGVITLPGFYEDFEGRRRGEPDFRSASRDVARLVDELKAEGIGGLVLDLRNNGGGSLREAVALTGLFIDQGPVVQQRLASGTIEVERDEQPGMAWAGPMAVLINRGSASASEILAAALQDYGRAVIVGETSFGKGTVQSLINLDEIAHSSVPVLGDLRLTVAQFFRVDGGTTQLRGVTPDIRFPSAFEAAEFGEASFDNALPWRRIEPAPHATSDALARVLPELQRRHDARTAGDPAFAALAADVAELQRVRALESLSLLETERRRERDDSEARRRARAVQRGETPADDDGLAEGEGSLAAELASEKRRRARQDVLLDETARIVGDAATLLPATP